MLLKVSALEFKPIRKYYKVFKAYFRWGGLCKSSCNDRFKDYAKKGSFDVMFEVNSEVNYKETLEVIDAYYTCVKDW